MKKIKGGVVLSMALGFSSVAIAASHASTKTNELKCHKELTRADGSKVTAHFSEADCKKLKHSQGKNFMGLLKKGEKVTLD